ncbi:MAG: hypothetical protein LUO88_04195 [Methanoregulaceae archaeon]|nr:hypothetical protein [Methanoregulaceae archaeon]
MADPASGIAVSFLAGLLTPLGASCVLPLYPAFLAFLSGRLGERGGVRTAAVLVTAGILCSMLLVGAVVVLVWQTSLAGVLAIVSPVVFIILAIAGLLLIAGVPVLNRAPLFRLPGSDSPGISAFAFGFFFGIVAMPCNPGPILVLFVISLTPADAAVHFLDFCAFGIGMASPLLALSAIPGKTGEAISKFLVVHQRAVQAVAGAFMLAVALYYLVWVFGPALIPFPFS